MTRSRHIRSPRRFWTKQELAAVRKRYPDEDTHAIARSLGRTVISIYQGAANLGVAKSSEYLARKRAVERERLRSAGVEHRFPKGHVPANQGLRRPGWFAGRMRETQFKKGQRPHTWRHPIGSTRLVDGYLYEKVREASPWTKAWTQVHYLLWKRAGKQIPRGHKLIFKDGDRTHIALENLELVSHGELMRRNSYHTNYPKEIARLIQMRGALQRRINRLERNGAHDRRSTDSPVRHLEGPERRKDRYRPSQGDQRRCGHADRVGEGRVQIPRGRRWKGIRVHPRRTENIATGRGSAPARRRPGVTKPPRAKGALA